MRYIGITPARAGKRRKNAAQMQGIGDHPRTRGEKTNLYNQAKAPRGSPPHTRGKANTVHKGIKKCGITPAHAGKSDLHRFPHLLLWDHPRTRGEKRSNVIFIFPFSGSPPHTRGKVYHRQGQVREGGITPAHAGKSHGFSAFWTPFWDHPRTRGEKYYTVSDTPHPEGSPPHTRGKGSSQQVAAKGGGITPAHAGKSNAI